MDSSALMTMLLREKGSDRLIEHFIGSLVSAVNVAEVQTKLVALGVEESLAWEQIVELPFEPVAFDLDQARLAGNLVKMTRPFGLSLGDRACLALGIQRNATVYTTDRVWKSLPLGIKVEVIR